MYIDILILSHLLEQPAHGYEIKKRVERTFRGMIPLNNKLLYPTLRKFAEMGAVVCKVEHTQGRPNRNVYSLTALGEDVLRGLLRNYRLDIALDDPEFLVRIAFFHLLDIPDRLDILRTRETIMRNNLMHMVPGPDDPPEPEQQGGQAVIAFLKHQIENELEWIATLIRDVETF